MAAETMLFIGHLSAFKQIEHHRSGPEENILNP
jgi:hypothetical protein